MGKIFKKVRYKNITVSFLPYLEGGGRNFGQEFIRMVRDRFGKVDHVFEYCAGPGFIGFSMLAHGLCNRLTVADVNPDAVECCKKTIKDNKIEDKAAVYLSDCLDSIPITGQWDLVVSNPPHWPSDEKKYRENIRNFDPYLTVHKKFYRDIKKFLKPDGSVLFQECEPATTTKDFQPMIEDNGLEIMEVFKADPLTFWQCVLNVKNIKKYTKPSAFYFIRSRLKK
ncbi:MAG: class I SAM-dependent methyltransferase [Candidatus Omnitrophota bacterium]|nr:class I SAM-dependent methyltransferase [Candidatus Omnitrophota bacterium]